MSSADFAEGDGPASEVAGWPTAGYELTVNGSQQPVADAWIGESLLFVLRERLGFTAVKDGCGEGECGSCTVLMDGQPTVACLVPAAAAQGREVETPEAHAVPQPDAVAVALAARAGAGCGFCLPGIGMQMRALLTRSAKPSAAAVREALSGHRCRCLPPERFIAAVDDAAAALARKQAQPPRETPLATSGTYARVPAQAGERTHPGDHEQTGVRA